MAPDSRLPVRPRPAGPRLVAPPGAGRVPPPGVGTGVRCGEPFVPGNGVRPERGPPSRPSRLTHVRVEPGAKPFVDDLLLGRGFVRSRAAPSLRSIESQPSTQGFVSAGRAGTRRPPAPARTRASGGVVGGASLSLPPPPRTRLLRLPTTACDLSRSSFPPGEGGGPRPCRAPLPARPAPGLGQAGVGCRGGGVAAVGGWVSPRADRDRAPVPTRGVLLGRRPGREEGAPGLSSLPFLFFSSLSFSFSVSVPAPAPFPRATHGACPRRRWSREPPSFPFFPANGGRPVLPAALCLFFPLEGGRPDVRSSGRRGPPARSTRYRLWTLFFFFFF